MAKFPNLSNLNPFKARELAPPEPEPAGALEPTDEEMDKLFQENTADEEIDPVDAEVGALIEAVEFCNETCDMRETCPLRTGFIRMAEGYKAIEEGFTAVEHPDVHIQLETQVQPFIEFLQSSREACAMQKHGIAKRAEAEAAMIKPHVDRVIRETLGSNLDEIKALLQAIAQQQNQATVAVVQAAPFTRGGATSQSAPPNGNRGQATVEEVPVRHVAPVADDEAARLILQYREASPDSDARAFHALFGETGVSISQAHRLTKISKGSLSNWQKSPTSQSTSSLNKERAERGG